MPSDDAQQRGLWVVRRPVLLAVGFLAGAATFFNGFADVASLNYFLIHKVHPWGLGIGAFLGGLIGSAAAHALDRIVHAVLPPMTGSRRRLYLALDLITWLPGLLPLFGAFGYTFVPEVGILLILLVAKLGVVALVSPSHDRQVFRSSPVLLAGLFLVSGFSALIYQVVWQRSLYRVFGVHIESVTVVVTAFMLGLGVGSMVGGALIRRFPDRAATWFVLCEMGIGLFGLASLPLIEWVGTFASGGDLLKETLAVLGLLFFPTFLMGATLPILVVHVDRRVQNLGQSVGLLYGLNTLGSAMAAPFTSDVLFVLGGLRDAVHVAAGLNLAVALGVITLVRPREPLHRGEEPSSDSPIRWSLSPGLVTLLAAASGYLALSQEIVWMRLVSHMSGGRPHVFAHVLGALLAGMAFGAHYGGRECARSFPFYRHPLWFIAAMFAVSSAFFPLSVTVLAQVHLHAWPLGPLVALVAIFLGSFFLSGIFPVLCHVYRSGETGIGVSKTYLANILGATLGPMVTGFVLFEVLPTSVTTVLLGWIGMVVAVVIVGSVRRRVVGPLVAVMGVGVALAALHETMLTNLLAHLQFTHPLPSYRYLYEGRSGIAATESAPGGDIVFGGGVYDGRMNTDIVVNSNNIDRCYLIPTLHPHPKRVFVLGLSSGSWVRVLSEYEGIEHIRVVEIADVYRDLISNYEEQGAVLRNPKVTLSVDDGRRWLQDSREKFDIIVSNTTFHWRANISFLLSEEFFRLCKEHLEEGGTLWINTTGSREVLSTLARVFRHVVVYKNIAGASDEPLDLEPEQRRQALKRFERFRGDVPVEVEAALEHLATAELVDLGQRLREAPYPVITDDNMWVEYKRGRFWERSRSWVSAFSNVIR